MTQKTRLESASQLCPANKNAAAAGSCKVHILLERLKWHIKGLQTGNRLNFTFLLSVLGVALLTSGVISVLVTTKRAVVILPVPIGVALFGFQFAWVWKLQAIMPISSKIEKGTDLYVKGVTGCSESARPDVDVALMEDFLGK